MLEKYCQSYKPGHKTHWGHWKRNRSRTMSRVVLSDFSEDGWFTVTGPDFEERWWCHATGEWLANGWLDGVGQAGWVEGTTFLICNGHWMHAARKVSKCSRR